MGWAKYQEDIISRMVQDNYSEPWTNPSERATLPAALYPWHQGLPPAEVSSKGASPFTAIQEKDMSKLKEFTTPSARPLPVIVLADVSGSMAANGKIDTLNSAIKEMIATFAEEDDTRAEIHVAVITFGADKATLYKPLEPASAVSWEKLEAGGRTPMGNAFSMAQQLIEDRQVIPGRAYCPAIVLVSDGVPTDDWKAPLSSLLNSERATKAARFAMGIGDDADNETLQAFLVDGKTRVFKAHEARGIKEFFRWVTMSVTSRSRSANPDSVVIVDPTDLDDFDF